MATAIAMVVVVIVTAMAAATDGMDVTVVTTATSANPSRARRKPSVMSKRRAKAIASHASHVMDSVTQSPIVSRARRVTRSNAKPVRHANLASRVSHVRRAIPMRPDKLKLPATMHPV